MITIKIHKDKYDVVFSYDYVVFGEKHKQMVWTCFIRRHKEVSPTWVGVAISNPNEAFNDDYAKRIAFKRAAENLVLHMSTIWQPLRLRNPHSNILADFRKAYWTERQLVSNFPEE